MSLDIINVSDAQLKRLGLSIFNRVNQRDVDVPLSDLVFEKTTDNDKVLLQNPMTKSGILMKKIALQDIFPAGINLRPFKIRFVKNAQEMTADDVAMINERHATDIVTIEADILDNPTSYDIELVKDFVLFCRVFGFYELGISDVTLNKYDGKLTIMVVPTHTLFTGYIEVLI